MSKQKTCFIISPIGKEGSEVRQLADDLMELIIVPALDRFDFDIIRADKIPRPSVITSDIIQLVQQSELCIIDLTGSNPNVFYECGRRHETGKPFIQLINKGDALPFDVAGIRTITYDLSSVRSARDSVRDIQSFVNELSSSDFEISTSGESLSSIANTLERLERKITHLSTNVAAKPNIKTADENVFEKIKIEANPRKAFESAFINRDFNTARKVLPILHKKLGNTGEVLASAGMFAESGDRDAAQVCLEILKNPAETIKPKTVIKGFAALVSFYEIIDSEKEAVKLLEPIFEKEIKREDFSNEDKAYFSNQLQIILYGADEYEKALKIAENVINLKEDASYYYNYSLICSKLSLPDRALEAVEKCLYLSKNEEEKFDYNIHAAVLFSQNKREKEAIATFNIAKRCNPVAAEFIASQEDTLKAVIDKFAQQ